MTAMRQKLKLTVAFCVLVALVVVLNFRNPPPVYLSEGTISAIESIRKDCGELCETVAMGEPGPYFDHITVPFSCRALFSNEYIDEGHGLTHAPKEIPKYLIDDFTMNNRLKVTPFYFDEEYLGKTAKMPVWTEKTINDWIELAMNNQLEGTYGVSETNALRDGLRHASGIKGGRVLVIGSEIPWVEACILEAGALEVVTLEYGRIVSLHPKVKTMVPNEFRKGYLDGSLGIFDAVVTFSSVEHSGLGRYGDGLNPWGDIISIARGWCVTKVGGSLTVGVMYDNELDYIKFNAGRWYGKIRYPYLTTNWKQHYRGVGLQRVHVFTKENINFTKPLRYYLKPPHPYHPVKDIDKKYSQAHQDETIYNIFPKERGFFIDIGANDGKLFSNSLWLERKHNWTGLLIEANPDLCRQIDQLERQAWRLCACISDTLQKTKFIQSGPIGGMASEIDNDHVKQIKNTREITVPCFNMDHVLDEVNVHHIDFFSLDVEGAELIILESMKKELATRKIIVDIWTIEYRIYDGKQNIFRKSLANLEKLRNFFKEIGGYTEHSQLNNEEDNREGMALDVVFIYIDTWCKDHNTLPNGSNCSI